MPSRTRGFRQPSTANIEFLLLPLSHSLRAVLGAAVSIWCGSRNGDSPITRLASRSPRCTRSCAGADPKAEGWGGVAVPNIGRFEEREFAFPFRLAYQRHLDASRQCGYCSQVVAADRQSSLH
jgi:hypothetical protein